MGRRLEKGNATKNARCESAYYVQHNACGPVGCANQLARHFVTQTAGKVRVGKDPIRIRDLLPAVWGKMDRWATA